MIKSSVHVTNKLFYRTITFMASFAALFVASAFLMYKLWCNSFSLMDFLTSSLMLGVLFLLFFAFVSYEMSSTLTRADGQESLSVFPFANLELDISNLITLLLPLILWSALVYLGQVLGYLISETHFTYYLLHSFVAVVLYCFIVGLIGVLLGLSLKDTARPIAYAVILLVVMMSSGIFSSLFSGRTIFNVPVAGVFDWFALFVPNSDWFADEVYGIPMEYRHWVLAAFWFFVLSGIILMRYAKRGATTIRCITGAVILASLACCICFVCHSSDYMMIKDARPEGLLFGEENYRVSHAEVDVMSASFSVERYVMNITAENKLAVSAEITVSEEAKTYGFTLHHGYKVQSVKNKDGKEISFERFGDYIDIAPKDGETTFLISYEGNGGKYYANRQGICLPGYFAWYPMAGHLKVWDYENNNYYVNTEFAEAYFEIKVSSQIPVFSNLNQDRDNTFCGKSDTVTLYAGMIEAASKNGLSYIGSPMKLQRTFVDPAEVEKLWGEVCTVTGITEKLSIRDKKLIFQPLSIVSSSGSRIEQAVILQNQLLLCNYAPTAEDICYSAISKRIPTNPEKQLLLNAFMDNIFCIENDAISEKPEYESVKVLKQYNSSGEILDEDLWNEYCFAETAVFPDLVKYQLKSMGRETALRQIYEYLISDDTEQNQIDFVYYIGGENND